MTPFFRSASLSDSNLFSAPRSLNDAVNWRFSNLRKISAPDISERIRECRAGVCSTAPAILAAAAWMSRGETGRFAVMQYYANTERADDTFIPRDRKYRYSIHRLPPLQSSPCRR